MAGVRPYLERGPATYTANVLVAGGQLVMPDTGGTIKPATAGAATVLGVAADDAAPVSSRTATNFASYRPEVAVYTAPADVAVTFAANASFGVKVKAAANGQATPWISGTDAADLIIGHVSEPAGATSGNPARIKLR